MKMSLFDFMYPKRVIYLHHLIIGGKDENHFFFIANRKSIITIEDTSNSEFIKDIVLEGYYTQPYSSNCG